jgi:cell division protein FtsB
MTDLTLEALQTALAPIHEQLAKLTERSTALNEDVAALKVQTTSIPLIWAAVSAIQEQVRHIAPIRAALKDLALTRVSLGEVETVAEDLEHLTARQSELEARVRALETGKEAP